MRRKFADLRLCAPVEDLDRFETVIRKAKSLGYKVVGVPLPQGFRPEKLEVLKSICEKFEVDLVTRKELSPENSRELLRDLRRFRRKFEVLAVICRSKPVARQAAKDRRVDLLLFQSDPRFRFFDEAEAELASNSLAALEIEIYPLLSLSGFRRVKLLSCLRSEVQLAARFEVPIIISSGAPNETFMRNPRELVALASLFDMPASAALKALSDWPLELVSRNREKLSQNFVAPGVKIVRRGSDCPNA